MCSPHRVSTCPAPRVAPIPSLQGELGLTDRVAYASKYSVNPCLQAINGELGALPHTDTLLSASCVMYLAWMTNVG